MAPPAAPRGPDGDDGGVCCMCGDRGLPHELLRCRLCRVRLQHRYCSDLYYPRAAAAAYRRCNWCLREPADGGGGGAQADAQYLVHTVGDYRPPEKRVKVVALSTMDEEERGQIRQPQQAGCSAMSRAAPPELGRPIKKQKAEEMPTTLPQPMPPLTLDEEAHRQSRRPQQAGCSAMGRAAPPELGRPIKKQKAEERPTALLPPPPPPDAAGSGSKKPPTQAAGKMAARPGRVKVRRYKLLAEVIINC